MKRRRQKKRWEDNINEWTGKDFASSTRAAENRKRWKGMLIPTTFQGYGIEKNRKIDISVGKKVCKVIENWRTNMALYE